MRTTLRAPAHPFQTGLVQRIQSFVRSPAGNGCAERFIRTLKEQLLWVRTFATVEELRMALLEWAYRYNEHWLLARHDFLSPSQARRELMLRYAA
ncbi:IS3 family transposase [Corallococcus macrosporus]|uniref:IS3 family transposase n=1 Tax=Myxococcus fulvus (strain ATCC BAA-855 / HW-1) TaxID=483219 RepID=F8CIR0_MYXFH|nr:IS3 family transposase [Corallococcus macrosporus]